MDEGGDSANKMLDDLHAKGKLRVKNEDGDVFDVTHKTFAGVHGYGASQGGKRVRGHTTMSKDEILKLLGSLKRVDNVNRRLTVNAVDCILRKHRVANAKDALGHGSEKRGAGSEAREKTKSKIKAAQAEFKALRKAGRVKEALEKQDEIGRLQASLKSHFKPIHNAKPPKPCKPRPGGT
jgi:hypothetical protein